MKRRDFLKVGTGISLTLPLANCGLSNLLNPENDIAWPQGIETWVPSVCGACPGGCGILVRKIDGHIVKVEGNPLHPLNQGRICPKGQAGIQLLYNQARILSPRVKIGDRLSGSWRDITWEEALDIAAAKLMKLRASGKAQTVVFLGQPEPRNSLEFVSRFLTAYGTPNIVYFDPWRSLKTALASAHGAQDLLAYDFENCRYILSFGAQFLTNWPTSMEGQRAYGQGRMGRKLKIVQVEPRFSLHASRADQWIPLKPGTEGLLALGIAAVIIRENLSNTDFISQFTSKFEDWLDERGEVATGFKRAVLSQVRLEDIAEMTQVPLKTIIQVAKEFASSKPALALADYNLCFQKDGLFSLQLIHCLNALVGSFDIPGGIVRQRKAPLKELPSIHLDETARAGLSQPQIGNPEQPSLDSLLEGSPYEINCLLISPSSLAANIPFYKNFRDFIKKIPFVISFQSWEKENLDFVDLVLPDTTYFEKWQLWEISPLSPKTAVGLGQPVVEPVAASMPFEETILKLAKKMGGPVAANFPWSSYKELLWYQLSGLYEARQGAPFLSNDERERLRFLEEKGWWTSPYDSFDSFLNDILARGGWEDPVYHFNLRSSLYQNPAKRFFFPGLITKFNKLPSARPENREYPFQLLLYDLPFTANDNGAGLPFFQETLGFQFELKWKIWVEINPDTADKLKIKDMDPVWVESPHGKIKAWAKIFPGVASQVVAIPLGKEEMFPLIKGSARKNDPLILIGHEKDGDALFSSRSAWVKISKRIGEGK